MIQQTYIGIDSVLSLKTILHEKNAKTIFLIHGKASYTLSGAEKVMKEQTLGYKVIEFFEFANNPNTADLEKGVSLIKKSLPDIVVAIGGGSVMDMAKLIRFFYSYSGDALSDSFIKEQNLLPLIAIPTTFGTGCEATHFAVLYHNQKKYSVAHVDMLPTVAIVDGQLANSNSAYLTACVGFDALAQAMESYWNVHANPESLAYAHKAISLLWNTLPQLVETPTPFLREQIAKGAYFAGKAINITKTTAPHAYSYHFTINHRYPHGHAVALTFPFFMELNCSAVEKQLQPSLNYHEYRHRIAHLLELIGLKGSHNLQLCLAKYITTLGLSLYLDPSIDIDTVIKQVDPQRLSNNPVELNNNIVDNFRKYLIKNQFRV